MRRGFGISTLFAAALATTAHAQTAPRPITLDEAVDLAARNAPAIVQAEGQQTVADATVRSAYGSFLPSLSLSASATRQLPSRGGTRIGQNGEIVTVPETPWSSSLGLGASVDVFDGGRRFFDLRQARARSAAAGANLVAQRWTTVLDVKRSYFDVLAARETEAAANAQVEQAEQQLRSSAARVKARTVTRSDSLRAEIQLRNARLAVLDAQTARAVAEASLTRAVGSATPVTAAPGDSLAPAPLALDESALGALAAASPLVQEAAASRDAARAAARASWTDYLPSLSASYSRSGSASGEDPTFAGDELDYNGSLRFSLSLPIFNQFAREQQVAQARVNARNAEAALADARLAAVETMTQALGALRSSDERIAAQTATVAAAEEDLRVQQQRYAVGGSTLLDVLTSQTQLDQARRDLIRARYDRRIAEAQLEALVGRDL